MRSEGTMESTTERSDEGTRVSEDAPVVASERTARVLARTLYKELRQSGLEERTVLVVATELLGLVARDLRDRS
jgi:hypothetical protein